jgi:small subunit ribosomal protein S6
MLRTYELMTILHPEVPEDQLSTELERISGHITSAGGTITEMLRESPWGRRRLAYPIRHGGRDVRDGYYTVFHFELAPDQVDEMERDLRLHPRLIRYLVTSFTPKPIDPKAVEEAEIAAEAAAADAYAAAQAALPAAAEIVATEPVEVAAEAVVTEPVEVAGEVVAPEPVATAGEVDSTTKAEAVDEGDESAAAGSTDDGLAEDEQPEEA